MILTLCLILTFLAPLGLLKLAVAISDALQARHDARSSGADADRAVDLAEFGPFHSPSDITESLHDHA